MGVGLIARLRPQARLWAALFFICLSFCLNTFPLALDLKRRERRSFLSSRLRAGCGKREGNPSYRGGFPDFPVPPGKPSVNFPVDNKSLLDELANVSKSFGLEATPKLMEMDGQGSPLLVGILRPAIVIPATTLSRLDASERAIVLGHELAHLRRGDLVWGLVAAIVRAVFFFHPLIRPAERRMKLAHEIAADELAITQQRHEPVSYAKAAGVRRQQTRPQLD